MFFACTLCSKLSEKRSYLFAAAYHAYVCSVFIKHTCKRGAVVRMAVRSDNIIRTIRYIHGLYFGFKILYAHKAACRGNFIGYLLICPIVYKQRIVAYKFRNMHYSRANVPRTYHNKQRLGNECFYQHAHVPAAGHSGV